MQCTDGDGKRASGSSETTPLHADWPAASLPLPYPQLDQSQAAHLSRYPLLLGTDAFPSAETGACLSEGEWVVYSNEWFLEFDCSWFYKLFYSVTLCGTSAGLGGCLVLPVSLSICLSVCLHSRRKTTWAINTKVGTNTWCGIEKYPAKELWKSVNIWGSYEQEFSVLFFDSRCSCVYVSWNSVDCGIV